jgi:hypothetical protein
MTFNHNVGSCEDRVGGRENRAGGSKNAKRGDNESDEKRSHVCHFVWIVVDMSAWGGIGIDSLVEGNWKIRVHPM